MTVMADWFGLREGRTDFQLETYEDREHLFARTELNEDILKKLNAAFRTGRPPKLVLFGDWGVGKTHTLRHIEYIISEKNEYNGIVVFLELPDVLSKSTFQIAHAGLLDALGFETVKQWMYGFQVKYQADAQNQIKKFAQSEDIANALMGLLTTGNISRMYWDWLRGLKLSSADAQNIGLSPNLDQSSQLVTVLKTLGHIYFEVSENLLVLMLDECTKIREVTNQDSMVHWKNAFKLLSDRENRHVGLICTVSINDPDDFPDPLADQQIRTRFSENNLIALPRFNEEETRAFLTAVLNNVIDPEKRAALISKYGSESDGETVSEDTFPFTKDAFDEFIDMTQRFGQATPRDTLELLDDMLNRAIDEELHIVASSRLDQLTPDVSG